MLGFEISNLKCFKQINMKLAFSTLGCPDWSLDKIILKAVEYGFKGVELRGIERELYLPRARDFSEVRIEEAKEKFERKGIKILCLSSSIHLIDELGRSKKELIDYAVLSDKLGTKGIRVFPGNIQDGMEEREFIAKVTENLSKLSDLAGTFKVNIFLETHGGLSSGKNAAESVRNAGNSNIGIIWDIAHTFQAGEDVNESYSFLKEYLKHLHIKDEIVTGTNLVKSVLIGSGKVPVKNVLNILRADNYNGYISFEWEKFWQKDIEEPETAFPHFINKMKEYGICS
ncbi:MAG: hypothetical protein A3J83_05450 [Elusimicrobia bacterium RIFOXYA2_FULL_40_6]|nr:MAG: hypothetical protein A3J83_05450 [Elusimicrobia bacterium RIFOXYA2_FULL_40_6]